MSITPFPSQGQYPWYDQLEQWGADTQTAAENATIAADQVHADVAASVNAANQAALDAQAAQAAAENAAGLVDAPAGAAVLAAISEGGAARAELDALVAPKLGRAEAAAIYAKKGDLPVGSVTSTQVARIVAVLEGEPVPALAEGDLVVQYRLPGNIYYKDFSGDTLDSEPGGMSKLLTGTATVKANAGAAGGQALEVAGITTAGTGYAITDTLDDEYLSIVEILVRWSPMDSTSSGIAFWVNMDTVADSAYRGSYNLASGYGQARITPRINGENETYVEVPVSVPPAFDAGSWVLTRMRIEEGVLSLKHWQDGAAEPGWQATMNDSRVPTNIAAPVGKVGAAAGFHIDYVVVATGGRKAVKP